MGFSGKVVEVEFFLSLFKTDQEESHSSRRKETASNTNLRTMSTLEKCRVILTQIWVKYVRTQPLG